MVRSSHRGRGSNQYQDKAPSVVDSVAHIERVRKMGKYTAVRATKTPLGHELAQHSVSDLASGLSSSLDHHIVEFQAGNLNERDVRARVNTISAYEDAIFHKHPNLYGQALNDAVHFIKDAKYNPQTKDAIRREGTPERALFESYGKLLLDAENQNLDLEELPKILDSINDAAIAREQGTSCEQ